MKLEAAAGLVCTRDTPSLSISFPYAGADSGWTGSSLSAHSFSASLYASALPECYSAINKGGVGEVGETWIFREGDPPTCQEAPDVHGRSTARKVPALAGGVGHTHRRTCGEHYHRVHAHLHEREAKNLVQMNHRLSCSADTSVNFPYYK